MIREQDGFFLMFGIGKDKKMSIQNIIYPYFFYMLEKDTRILIDAKLKKAGWEVNNHRQVATELPIDRN